jgi:PQQ-like domain/Abnormal spindle-like microcephaly-assoc'd, ASPM-SPD-2-Hydin
MNIGLSPLGIAWFPHGREGSSMQALGDWTGRRVHRTARRINRTAAPARRLCSVAAAAALALAGLAALTGGSQAGVAAAAPAQRGTVTVAQDETTASDNDLRTGWDPDEPTLTPAAVGGGSFGQVFKTAVQGQVYAQPLVAGNTLIVATEKDWVYGLNAATGAAEWSTQLGTPYHITTCGDLTPNIGVTSTPVYDPSTGIVYVMAMVKEIGYGFHLFGLNASTGAVVLKKRIAGSPANDRHISFSPVPQDQRTGLLLMNGWVYAGFGSHCDHKPYAGYIAGVDVAQRPLKTTLWTDEAGVSDDQAGIWQSGGGLMSDGPNRIFFTSGNGISPAPARGNSPPGQLAESVVRLGVNPNGSLTAQQFFSPFNAPKLDASDIDFGAGGPVGLPFGTSRYPHILAQAGKYGTIYLLNRDNLGGRDQGPGGGDQDLDRVGPYAGQWGHPAVFADTTTLTSGNAASASDYLVYVGNRDYMREFKFGVSGGKPVLTDYANSTFTLGYTSGSPVITSNGTDPSSAIIWAVNSSGGTGTHSSLGAWDLLRQPKNGGGTKLSEIWSGDIGTAAKFTIAATDNGMVYAGTRDDHVYGFGSTTGSALTRSGTVIYPGTPVGSAASAPVTLTATKPVTVSGASVTSMNTPNPYSVGRVTVTRHGSSTPVAVKFPVTLQPGDVLRTQVKFAPAAPGGAPGQVTFAASSGSPGSAAVPLIGDGTGTGLAATPSSLQFVLTSSGQAVSNVPVGISVPLTATIVNTSTAPEKVTSVTAPRGPYSYLGLPRPGAVIEPGQSLVVEVTFGPGRAGPAKGSIVIRASHGPAIRVALTGTGLAGVSKFTAFPSSVHFGRVRVGHTATVLIHVFNRGNQPSLMQRTPAPGGPFGAPVRVTSGLPVNPAYDLVLPVTFRPARAGAVTSSYTLKWTDRFGTHTLTVPITGTGVR